MEKRPREEDEVNSPVVKKLKDSLQENLDVVDELSSSEPLSDRDLAPFEDEITVLPSTDKLLSFLLDASDDELGLPQLVQGGEAEGDLFRVVGSEFWTEPELDDFDRYGFGEPVGLCVGGEDEEYIDGLFDYSDIGFGSGPVLWMHEYENLGN